MTLLEKIKSNATLSKYLCDQCSENGISLQISNTITEDDFLIIKVDDYYNAEVHPSPASPDCLIVQKCADGRYLIYIVELKDIIDQHGFTLDNMKEKYNTCLDDFMGNRFGDVFHDYNFIIKTIKLYFITDPYGFKEKPDKQLNMRGHKLDSLMAIRIPKYFNLHLYIEHRLPNPTILPCI